MCNLVERKKPSSLLLTLMLSLSEILRWWPVEE